MQVKVLPNKSGIYQIVNKVNEKKYIGYASNIRTRVNAHKNDLDSNRHTNEYLQQAWNKYGEHSFSFEVIELCGKDQLCIREDYWVNVLQTNHRYFGYNLKPTAPDIHSTHSPETIKKIKSAKKGKGWPKEARAARNAIPMSDEHKIRLAKERARAIEELGISHKERQRITRGKRIISTKTGKIYRSVGDLCEQERLARSTMLEKLRGSRKNNTEFQYL